MAKWQRLVTFTLRALLVEVIILMALGAFVRAMNAGLACPDWPLCFGKVIPDFHPGVWYEFIHRADAGLVAITFLCVAIFLFFSKASSAQFKKTAALALLVLVALISAGALTVLKQVAWLAVTTHLTLATTFFALIFRLLLLSDPKVVAAAAPSPRNAARAAIALSLSVFLQIVLGGIVASTYAGSVCVDWPLCNGAWVPTWQGAIGHQISHRFFAYVIFLATLIFAAYLQRCSRQPWMTPQILWISRLIAGLTTAQVALGILNLVYFIPAWLTVPHQSLAVVLLAANLRQLQIFMVTSRAVEHPVELQARPS